jgi:hypothetical protein
LPGTEERTSITRQEFTIELLAIMRSNGPPGNNSQARNTATISVPSVIALFAFSLWPLGAQPPAWKVDQQKEDPNSFVRDILGHEVEAQLQDKALWSYRELKVEAGKQKLFVVYQTKDGEIDRLIAVNGQPLGQAEAQEEDRRIAKLISRPRQMRQEQKKKTEDGEHARNLLKMFPDAFQFEYDGRQGDLVKLKFTPNPRFHAEGHPAQVFHHMEGTLLLNPSQKRLVAIDGKLISEVKFGGGLLGHLDRGGIFSVKQEEVSQGYWEVTRMHVEMKGKALFFKTIGAHDEESYSDFKRVPDNASLQQGAEAVRKSASGK